MISQRFIEQVASATMWDVRLRLYCSLTPPARGINAWALSHIRAAIAVTREQAGFKQRAI